MSLLIVRHLIVAQLFVATLLVVGYTALVLIAGADGWIAISSLVGWVAIGLMVALGYVVLGVQLAQGQTKLGLLVVRHVFRAILAGAMLVLLQFAFADQISPIPIGSFILIHWLSWWWVFGKKRALGQHVF